MRSDPEGIAAIPIGIEEEELSSEINTQNIMSTPNF